MTLTSQSSFGSLEVDIDSNENKDTSNLKSETIPSPKKSPDACFSIMNCLPITADSEAILVKQ